MSWKHYLAEQTEQQVMALLQWADSNVESTSRLHMSEFARINPRSKGQFVKKDHYRMNGKPFGLWYAIGTEWLQFLIREFQSNIYNYIFEIQVNSTVLVLNTTEEKLAFEERYCEGAEKSVAWGNYIDGRGRIPKSVESGQCNMPDWTKVARDYNGIELNPDKVWGLWIREWAVNSGCVWNKRGIKSIKLIAKYENGQYINV